MLFNSYEFILVFLPLTFIGYFLMGAKFQPKLATGFLALMSLVFYGYWDVRYVPLLLGSILFNYLMGRIIEERVGQKLPLIFGIVANLLLLGYSNFAV